MTPKTENGTRKAVLGSNLVVWARRVGLARKLALALVVAALISVFATYGAVTRSSSPFGPDPGTVASLLLVNLVLVLLLGALVSNRLVRLWIDRRRGSAGSRLHTRLVSLFSIVAVLPAIIVGAFSVLLFDLGLQAWFGDRVRTALQASVAVAEAYTEEHKKVIEADVLTLAAYINRDARRLANDPRRLQNLVVRQAAVRSLPEAIVVDGSGRVLARSALGFSIAFEPIPDDAMERARSGEVVVITHQNDDRVRALVRIDRISDVFLYVGRYVDPQVVGHAEQTRSAVAEYMRLESERSTVQITQALIFLVVALLLLLAAVWFALSFASRLVGPISSLVGAAEKIRDGDLSVRVPEGPPDDEVGTLSRAFNRMTGQLEGQRGELMSANEQLETRRRFTEAVLSGVSAGVIGLDSDGRIDLPNRSAVTLLETSLEDLTGQPLSDAVPEMTGLFLEAKNRPGRRAEGQVKIVRKGRPHILLVRVAAERGGAETEGFVVTFDDITELVTAQRMSAWADIARRIAHEIKNPLTPIQLSAERLKRKYLGQVTSEPEVFESCTDTIIRQVGDIGRMVDEFSAFARMPSPRFETENVVEIAKQAVFMQQVAHPEIAFDSDLPNAPVTLGCDRRQVAQALTNLLQNAADALGDPGRPGGEIKVHLTDAEGIVALEVSDNGPGLPEEDRHRLTEPYVTHRVKGTGLGLAIVQKVMEDHGGRLYLDNRAEGGAIIRLEFDRAAGASLADAEAQKPRFEIDAGDQDKVRSHG